MHFAWKKKSVTPASAPAHPKSETRLRVAVGRVGDVSLAVYEVDLAVRERGASTDDGVVMALRLIERAFAEVDHWSATLGAQHVCDAWLDACAQWVMGVGSTLVSAFGYDEGPERRIALQLAAEESAMRLLMGLDRQGSETISMLKNLDGNASRSASELAMRIELADRILHARLEA